MHISKFTGGFEFNRITILELSSLKVGYSKQFLDFKIFLEFDKWCNRFGVSVFYSKYAWMFGCSKAHSRNLVTHILQINRRNQLQRSLELWFVIYICISNLATCSRVLQLENFPAFSQNWLVNKGFFERP